MEKSVTEGTSANTLNLTFINNTPYDWNYITDHMYSGSLNGSDQWSYFSPLSPGTTNIIIKGKNSVDKGISGYVTFNINGQAITFAFSVPSAGSNKVGVGIDGQRAWENMSSHYENPQIYNWGFTSPLPFNLRASFENTPGDLSTATITMSCP